MPTTVNWPTDRAFAPRRLSLGASVPKAGWAAFFTGGRQSISHLADRLRCTITLPPCNPLDAGRREAFFLELASTGNWVRVGHLQRQEPQGTLRGTPTVASSAAAGARSVSVQGVVGNTLLAGDPLGAGGHLMLTGYAGAVANGSGVLTVPLVLPLRVALSAGAAVTWQMPTTTWQLETDLLDLAYGRALWQDAVDIPLREV